MIRNVLVLSLLIASRVAVAQSNQDADIIRASRISSNAALARHDIDGMAKYWLPDFVQTIGRGTSLTGKDTIIGSMEAIV